MFVLDSISTLLPDEEPVGSVPTPLALVDAQTSTLRTRLGMASISSRTRKKCRMEVGCALLTAMLAAERLTGMAAKTLSRWQRPWRWKLRSFLAKSAYGSKGALVSFPCEGNILTLELASGQREQPSM